MDSKPEETKNMIYDLFNLFIWLNIQQKLQS